MSATNLDLPVLISADQIRRREFVTIRRGYDPDQVRAYLEQLADQMEVMRSMVREARTEAETAVRAASEPRLDPYEQLAARVSNVIREADNAAEKIRAEAISDAEQVTDHALAEADRINTDAQARAEEARERADTAVRVAREEADRTIAGLATRRDALVGQLASMQERLLGVARELETAMDVKASLPELEPFLSSMPTDRDAIGHVDADHVESHDGTEGAHDDPDGAGDQAADGGHDEAPFGTIVVGEAEESDLDGPSIVDPPYDELWDGTEAIKVEFPDIPSLDLDWGELEDDGGESSQH
ncbi:MAG TPA: DivIVA domain-containing protein [Actinomycetota bacterium]|nr:DivIVA domain-containing protein [Actinomycetota bacterium]